MAVVEIELDPPISLTPVYKRSSTLANQFAFPMFERGEPQLSFEGSWQFGGAETRMTEIAVDNLLAALDGKPMPHQAN